MPGSPMLADRPPAIHFTPSLWWSLLAPLQRHVTTTDLSAGNLPANSSGDPRIMGTGKSRLLLVAD